MLPYVGGSVSNSIARAERTKKEPKNKNMERIQGSIIVLLHAGVACLPTMHRTYFQ